MRKLCLLLIVALGPALIAFFHTLLLQHNTAAYNTYVNEYRKWPWRAGVWHTVTTLPFQAEHAPPAWVQHDIDVGGSFPVHSASSRGVVSAKRYVPEQEGRAGYMVAIQEQDGLQYHVYYLHLAYPGAIPELNAHVFQGQLIAFSGETGCPGCGAHLHFGMSTEPYAGDNISIFPLAGFTNEEDIDLQSYLSDNAGIGDACGPPCDDTTPLDGTHYDSFTQVFQSHGGYDGMGVTWDPCGGGVCWWVHPWTSEINPSYTGVAQDFDSPDPTFGTGAIMQGDGLSSFTVYGDFWQKYISYCEGHHYFDYLGYPVSEQFEMHGEGDWWIQGFQNGYMDKEYGGDVVYARNFSGEPFGSTCDQIDSDGDLISDDDEINIYHTDPLKRDTDGDGCAESEEIAGAPEPKPGFSGPYDPLAWYDFFDVPVPAAADPAPNGPRNGIVDAADPIAVLYYAFASPTGVCGDNPNGNGVDYDCDKGIDTNGDTVAEIPPDGVPDGRDYDRTVSPPPNPPMEAGPPTATLT
jgi:hypothetical protein